MKIEKRKIIITVLYISLLLFGNEVFAGVIRGIVVEKETQLPIPFASVAYYNKNTLQGVISDVNGKFEIDVPNIQSLTVSSVGYVTAMVQLSSIPDKLNITIGLETKTFGLNEVVVTPANNPAIPIMKKVLANKDRNNYEKYPEYSYRNYIKTITDMKLSNDTTRSDSMVVKKGRKRKKVGIVSEIVVDTRRYKNNEENKIIASRTSGISDPILSQGLYSLFHSSISFYNNTVAIFRIPITDVKSVTDYLSPISDGCLGMYAFELEVDNLIIGEDTTYIIDYFPKRRKNFNGLSGKLYISSNGYALKDIIAQPYEKGFLDFRFRQKYALMDGKWFPTKLEEEVGMPEQKVTEMLNTYSVFHIVSTNDSIKFDLNGNNNVGLENIYLDKNSLANSESILNVSRKDSLTQAEKNTYKSMDSLSRAKHLDYKIKLIKKLYDTKIPAGIVDLDLRWLYNVNNYEGQRLGMGIRTNNKLSDFIAFEIFGGYGWKDDKLKYGGEITLDIDKYNEGQLRLSYLNDLKEVGMDMVTDHSRLSYYDELRRNIGYRFDKGVEYKAELAWRFWHDFKIYGTLSLKELEPGYDYQFHGQVLDRYRADDISVLLHYAYGTKLTNFADIRSVMKSGNPRVSLMYRRGINWFSAESYNYNRLETTFDYTHYSGRVGQTDVRLAAGYIDRSVPYSLLFTGEGSKNNDVPLVINNTFQTMSPYEFLSDKYVHLFFQHNLGSMLFETRHFKPQFVLVQNSGWGMLSSPSDQSFVVKTKDKVYLESGLIVNNLLRFKVMKMFYLGVGAGGFYRYGYYSYGDFADNFVTKLAFLVTLK